MCPLKMKMYHNFNLTKHPLQQLTMVLQKNKQKKKEVPIWIKRFTNPLRCLYYPNQMIHDMGSENPNLKQKICDIHPEVRFK